MLTNVFAVISRVVKNLVTKGLTAIAKIRTSPRAMSPVIILTTGIGNRARIGHRTWINRCARVSRCAGVSRCAR